MSTGKRFEVKGTDEHGDVHIFGTDLEELAHEMVETMKQDLQDVKLTYHPAAEVLGELRDAPVATDEDKLG